VFVVEEPHPASASSSRPAGSRLEPALGVLLLGRYRIERCLERGDRGTLHAAYDQVIGDTVALELFDVTGVEGLESFRREVRLARRVTHRNVARIFDLGEVEGTPFITMELIEGESLRVRLAREGHLPVDVAVGIALQIARGLHAAHEVDVLHRDLRPANILFDAVGRAVITDFGVADPSRPPSDASIYVAPEQRTGERVDARADLHALGMMLRVMLTGLASREGDALLPDLPPDVPAPLVELMRQCAAPDPAQRPASAREVVTRLESLLVEGVVDDAPSPLTPPPSERLEPPELTVAILPFRDQGPPVPVRPAATFREELIDLLTMTHGVRISTREATRRLDEPPDARDTGRAQGVDATVEGTVQLRGDQVRIVVRLVSTNDGVQRWSGRFAERMRDPSALRQLMAKRVAEVLRKELVLLRYRATASDDAIELFRRGRERAAPSGGVFEAIEQAAELFERARALSPGFAPAVAARADAVVRRWFFTTEADGAQWYETAREAVSLALSEAQTLPDTHLAAARLEVNRGNFGAAAHHLTAALTLAPTHPAAHEYLGMLQCDAGRSDQGTEHIQLAHRLDPALGSGTLAVLRCHALRGRTAEFEELLERMRHSLVLPRFAVALFEARIALWSGDEERAGAVGWPVSLVGPAEFIRSTFVAALDPAVTDDQLARRIDIAIDGTANPRLRAAWLQIAVELLAWRGAAEAALACLVRADDEGMLVDADWLECCPVLALLRPDPRFAAVAKRVRARADTIWQVGRQGI